MGQTPRRMLQRAETATAEATVTIRTQRGPRLRITLGKGRGPEIRHSQQRRVVLRSGDPRPLRQPPRRKPRTRQARCSTTGAPSQPKPLWSELEMSFLTYLFDAAPLLKASAGRPSTSPSTVPLTTTVPLLVAT